MYRHLIILVLFMFNLSQIGFSAAETPPEETSQLFAYDRSASHDVQEVSSKSQNGVTVKDIQYAARTPERGRIKAYLIQPSGKGPFGGILFFHWLGEPNGDRNQFVSEAINLSKQGTVSLLIQGYFPWVVEPKDGKTDRQRVIDETIEVRRALDLLLSQPGVDAKRIGFVGHDYGAMYGAISSAVDKRVKTYIFMAPIGSFSDWSLAYWLAKIPENDKDAYRKSMDAIDPIRLVANASPAPVLLQFAREDEHVSKAAATAFAEAVSEPKEIKWYAGKHELHVPNAEADRREWLMKHLGFGGSAES